MLIRLLIRYLRDLTAGRVILWCYFIWYLVVAIRYFDPSPGLWMTAGGISLIIGTALWINTAWSGPTRLRLGRWPIIRLYLFPFCVSSFSALVKGKNFVLIFSPRLDEMALAAGLCAVLIVVVAALKKLTSGVVASETAVEPLPSKTDQIKETPSASRHFTSPDPPESTAQAPEPAIREC